jgi:hypothetical protein
MKSEYMNRLQSRPRQPVKRWRSRLWLAVAIYAGVTFGAGSALAQLSPNQTNGFGNRALLTFTDLQNFDCVDMPTISGLQRDQGAV